MISMFFYGTGFAIIIIGLFLTIFSFQLQGGLFSISPLISLISSIFIAMFYFAIGKGLDYLKRNAEASEKIYNELLNQKNSAQ
ncbi:membrane protein implicated in regulation of membrane protease activity [Cytobacillus horneckiae]|uniref:hypothetical protein n=1 Tax=Cytobacillus horneckiae TaxID=549687 RepID=UPI0019D17147|nr:hypothetical protein [Cytobacillus horneckiae]MBN6889832.1 hypothetical protein [Cytobacillus horneckiae]